MQQALEDLSRIERSRRYDELIPYLARRRFGATELHALVLRRGAEGGAVAFLLAQALINGGVADWRLPLIMTLAALELGQVEAALGARTALAAQLAAPPAGDRPGQAEVFRNLLRHYVIRAAAARDDALVLRYLDLWGLVAPAEAALFAQPVATAPYPLEEIRRAARAQDRRIVLPPLPTPRPHSRRKCVVAMRKHFYLHAGSREHELGPRFIAAIDAYGWEAIFHGLRTVDRGPLLAEEYRALVGLCRAQQPDILFLDEFLVGDDGDEFRGDAVASLRRDLPDLKIVGLIQDAWPTEKHAALRSAMRFLDVLMSPFPSMALWREAEFAGKYLPLQIPHGGENYALAGVAFDPTLTFHGSVGMGNWHRAFWLARLREAGVPLRATVASHAADNLPGLASFRRYMEALARQSVVLNFSMRSTGARIFTGRVFEALLAGSLLVQEQSDDVDCYLVPGEHYLPFTNLGDLLAIARFLAERPEEAQIIRERGHRFMRETYSDARVLHCLERHLYGAPVAWRPPFPSPALVAGRQ